MTDPNQGTTPDPASADAPQPRSPGLLLREGRERHQLTTQQVAERLRLRLQIVEDMEQDRFSEYVSSTFTRGYLRAYARLVQVNEDEVFRAYDSLGLTDQTEAQQMQSFSRRTRQQTQDSRLMAVTYVVGLVIIGSAIIFWWQNAAEEEVAATRPSVAERLVDEQATEAELEQAPGETSPRDLRREPIFIDQSLLESVRGADVRDTDPEASTDEQLLEEAEQGGLPEDRETLATNDEEAAPETVEAPSEEPEPQPEEAVASDPTDSAIEDYELVLRFAGDTWIRIEGASGEALAFGVKHDGHETLINDDAPYEVTLGAPENVTLYFRGEPVDLSAYRAGRVARITLPEADE